MDDIEKIIKLFNDFFLDKIDCGGYYFYLDFIILDFLSELLGWNKGIKNWNLVGDYVLVYLINFWLVIEKFEYVDMFEYIFDIIEKCFLDYENCFFVNEKFFEDWSVDYIWGW